MLTMLAPLMEKYGFPTIIALALAYMMDQQRRESAKERTEHTVILVDQMYELRLACGKGKRAVTKTTATPAETEPEIPFPDISAVINKK